MENLSRSFGTREQRIAFRTRGAERINETRGHCGEQAPFGHPAADAEILLRVFAVDPRGIVIPARDYSLRTQNQVMRVGLQLVRDGPQWRGTVIQVEIAGDSVRSREFGRIEEPAGRI